ncbi:hypothetical protein H6G89_23415 [Oscillatoria sp. FACHB-1407]|uniref:hypothetical protein n=1 Tax=Oscillatoria sp. FACHB-1407 TaxID=2692847 RepID=UPI0016882982|nr:hypothetical protein [Oscillatoria sp. FACHB-1407]MBD2463955.1 hypothetical protein [Oscillatoria sp. FACHB-1407]
MTQPPSPLDFPKQIPAPRYAVGTRCRWIPQPSTDWGIIIGHILLPSETTPHQGADWRWSYLLMLDNSSPSRRWTVMDWVSEDDLELFPMQPVLTQNPQQEGL